MERTAGWSFPVLAILICDILVIVLLANVQCRTKHGGINTDMHYGDVVRFGQEIVRRRPLRATSKSSTVRIKPMIVII